MASTELARITPVENGFDRHLRTSSKRVPPKKPPRKNCKDSSRCNSVEHHNHQDDDNEATYVNGYLNGNEESDHAADLEHCGNEEAMLEKYSWIPPGLTPTLVDAFMKCLPRDKVPSFENPQGIKYRNRQLMLQMPLQDIAIQNCQHLMHSEEKRLHDEFVKSRRGNLGAGHVEQAFRSKNCYGCKDEVQRGSPCVIAIDVSNDSAWHPQCFVCYTCKELLIDLIFYHHNDRLYCGRHEAETVKARCFKCDELIFSSEYVKAGGKSYHQDHFSCFQCDIVFNGQQHLIEDNHPVCVKCYNDTYAHKCAGCHLKIALEERDLVYNNQHWHEACLVCSGCHNSLSSKPFVTQSNAFLCSDCYKRHDTRKCHRCKGGFDLAEKRLETKGLFWHNDCFTCDICVCPIVSKRYVQKNNMVVCNDCYEKKYAQKCAKCLSPLTDGGVSYNNKSYHKDCFICDKCQLSIAAQAFSVKDGHCYCTPCYATLYAKTCSGCKQFIIGGEYLSLDSDHWHSNCFKCDKCKELLIQRTFAHDGSNVKLLCEKCL